MPRIRRHIVADLSHHLPAIRARFELPDGWSPEVLADAERVAAAGPHTPASVDRRDLPLVALDPAGSRDIDQAFHLARRGAGWRFHYAIADVGAWLLPGDPVEAEARRRGVTVYLPDARVPLHPPLLSEGAMSLLEGQDRPALLWAIDLDAEARVERVHLERALVRNHGQLDYVSADRALAASEAHEQVTLLAELGPLLLAREAERGGVSLNLPEQNVEVVDGGVELHYRAALPVEAWNAQLSLCCGMAAAGLMLDAGVGVLRTMPPAPPEALEPLARSSRALGVTWPEGGSYAEWVRSLDVHSPAGAALMHQAARLFRGAGYTPFDGARPELVEHAAIAAPYAHVTAPLRRLVDRFANECVLAAVDGCRPPEWVVASFAELPGLMAEAGRRAGAVDRSVVDVVEALVLAARSGEVLHGVVTGLARGRAFVQFRDPAVIHALPSDVCGGATAGDEVAVRLVSADADAAAGGDDGLKFATA